MTENPWARAASKKATIGSKETSSSRTFLTPDQSCGQLQTADRTEVMNVKHIAGQISHMIPGQDSPGTARKDLPLSQGLLLFPVAQLP